MPTDLPFMFGMFGAPHRPIALSPWQPSSFGVCALVFQYLHLHLVSEPLRLHEQAYLFHPLALTLLRARMPQPGVQSKQGGRGAGGALVSFVSRREFEVTR